jgi:hypothetical protein
MLHILHNTLILFSVPNSFKKKEGRSAKALPPTQEAQQLVERDELA